MLVIDKPFQPKPMFVGKARSLLNSGASEGASLGSAPALTANIRLGWISLQEINTQAYYKPS